MKWLLCCLLACSPWMSDGKEPIANYMVLFSPQDHLADELISMVDKERKSIKAAVYCFTHRGIVQALRCAHERGVAIEVIVDPCSVRSKSVLRQTASLPFPVLVWCPPPQFRELANGKRVKRKKSLMHDKFCVFGDNRVWTGSFNFTLDGALLHQENALVVESREVASSYLSEFEKIKTSGCVPLEAYLEGLK